MKFASSDEETFSANKKFLPITKNEFEMQILCLDFIRKIKSFAVKNNIRDIRFIPQLKGYEIELYYKNNAMKIFILYKNGFFSKLRIRTFVNGKLIISFTSKSKSDNSVIVDKIFNR
ncbi:MAG: hypothetical protein NC110_01790 [Ruminococcus sp.]|nr:hypothetical protein [Ruminococcus sp.]